jgi:hypothetical protein
MVKSATTQEAKSKWPIWIGAIAGPLLFNVPILLIWSGYYGGPNGLDFLTLLLSIVIPLGVGALLGFIARLIAKTQRGAIVLTVIANVLVVGACFLSLVVLVVILAYNAP